MFEPNALIFYVANFEQSNCFYHNLFGLTPVIHSLTFSTFLSGKIASQQT